MAIQNNFQLNGLQALPFGLIPAQLFKEVVDPTSANYNTIPYRNFQIGTFWLNTTNNNLWYLANIATSPKVQGNWTQIGGIGLVKTLTSNSGGAVGPTLAGNINIVGDGTTITGVGNPVTNTITLSAVNTGTVSTLTGNSGGAISPTAGNINVVGSGVITVVGNSVTSTLTVTPSGSISNSFVTDLNTATPALGIINFNARAASGSSVSFSGATNVVTLNLTDASANTIAGNNSGNLTLSGSNNTGLGKSVLHALTTGNSNTVIGSLSGALITTGGSNTIVGEGSGVSLLTGTSNIIIGQGSGNNLTGAEGTNLLIGFAGLTGTSGLLQIGIPGDTLPYLHNWGGGNFFAGRSGNFTLNPATAVNNAALGGGNLLALTTGSQNTTAGSSAGAAITTGSNSVAIGAGALTAATTSSQNTAVGGGAASKITTGSGQNVAVGPQTLFNLVTGATNVCVGVSAGNNYTGAESNNICIGSSVVGVLGESNNIYLGLVGTHAKNFQAGIRGVTTDAADAIAVLISSTGQLGTVSSSIRYKDNVEDMADASSNIMHLRPVTFNYKQSKAMQYGLIAEDVALVMPRLAVMDSEGNPETVKYHELPSLLLNELIKLSKRVEELENKLSNFQ